MASGASQMTDERGCHGDGANEEVICGTGAWQDDRESYKQERGRTIQRATL